MYAFVILVVVGVGVGFAAVAVSAAVRGDTPNGIHIGLCLIDCGFALVLIRRAFRRATVQPASPPSPDPRVRVAVCKLRGSPDLDLPPGGPEQVARYGESVVAAADMLADSPAAHRVRVFTEFRGSCRIVTLSYQGSADAQRLDELDRLVERLPGVPASGLSLELWFRVRP